MLERSTRSLGVLAPLGNYGHASLNDQTFPTGYDQRPSLHFSIISRKKSDSQNVETIRSRNHFFFGVF